jgi:hypothetical protein
MTERAIRVVLGLLGLYHLVLGVLALLAPGTFFEEIGRYGAENLHYVGDVGAFTAAYGVALLLAVGRPSWWVPMLALGAVWYGLHAFNHIFDTDEARSEARGWVDTALLAGAALALAWLAAQARRLEEAGGVRSRRRGSPWR